MTPVRRFRFGRRGATAVSVAAHGLAAAGLLLLSDSPPSSPSPTLAVEIAALAAPAPPIALPAEEAPPAPSEPVAADDLTDSRPADEPAESELRPLAEDPAPTPEPEHIPPPAPPKPAQQRPVRQVRPQPRPLEQTTVAREHIPVRVPAPNSVPAFAPSPAPVPSVAAPIAAGPPPSWLAAVRSQLERNKAYPDSARFRRQEGTAVLRFVIDRSGRVVAHDLVKSSGVPSLDRAAEEMLRRASPVPAIPPEIPSSQFEMTIPVSFTLR